MIRREGGRVPFFAVRFLTGDLGRASVDFAVGLALTSLVEDLRAAGALVAASFDPKVRWAGTIALH